MSKFMQFKHINLAVSAVFIFLSVTVMCPVPVLGAEKPAVQNDTRPVYVIPVSGEVSPEMSAFIKRAVTSVPKTGDPLIVLEMDTFGGRVDSALQIVDTITSITGASTLAYVKTKAISAGALIALSCERMVMKNNTTIGDCAPISYGPEGPTMLGEKFQSPLRAQFRALAKKNGYDENLAESMVSENLEIIRVTIDGKVRYLKDTEFNDLPPKEKARVKEKKIVVRKGELLTMDSTEALKLGFSKASVSTLEDGLKAVGIKTFRITAITKTWTERFLAFIISISPILMMVGLTAVYMEMKMPGFGTPGIVGIICLSLAFGSQYTVGLANYTELLIILLGLVLLGLEMFVIPGFGIAGISGFAFITIGLILSLQDFVIPKPSMPWQKGLMIHNVTMVVGSYVIAVVGGLMLIRYLIPRLSIGRSGPYLSGTLRDARASAPETLAVRVGDEGVAMSYLRPSGKMRIGTEYYDVISQGEFIEQGTPVTVTGIQGNRIIVSRKDAV